VHPILFGPIHTFGVMVLLGVLLGLAWVRYDAPRLRLDPEDATSLAVEVFLAGLIGSRLQFVLHNWESYQRAGLHHIFYIWEGGLVWYGGFLAGLPVAVWRMRKYGFPVLRTMDLLAPCVIIGLGIGRIGCLMAGDDHGRMLVMESNYQNFVAALPAKLAAEGSHMTAAEWMARNEPIVVDEIPWYAIRFDDPRALVGDGYRGEYLLPTQPMMTIKCFLIAGILIALRKRLVKSPGALAALLFALYPIGRFIVEIYRGDLVRGVYDVGGVTLSMSQIISIFVFPPAVVAFVVLYVRGRREWDRLVAEGKDPMALERPVRMDGSRSDASKPEQQPAEQKPAEPKAAEPKPPEQTPAEQAPAESPPSPAAGGEPSSGTP
jgi:phosphatidylglycerol---prolipoprotein diacylglyceryl transferase